jgi:hypothetical protein
MSVKWYDVAARAIVVAPASIAAPAHAKSHVVFRDTNLPLPRSSSLDEWNPRGTLSQSRRILR